MMRSLWTAASGMNSQQYNVDTIANNLANVNTTAYKKERAEFSSLLYQTLDRATVAGGATSQPTNLQVGHGVRVSATARDFTMGGLQQTGNNLDIAIEGEGFFMVQIAPGSAAYTRDGSFKLSSMDGEYILVTSDGFPVLDIDEEMITFETEIVASTLGIASDGSITYVDADGEVLDLGIQIALVQFSNRQGLEAIGSNLYATTPASGEAIFEADGELTSYSALRQGFLELSNVQLADEMVKLIVAQRAYEVNSKAIQTSDTMLQQANQMKG